ncbi:MAG TPA: YidC/Oxa1 family membrane protein insertase, partial [Armatimonadota bacterium]|nr:YidC/Oxa1 family membrane protein insertase [Armatimonadota bacterium]
MDLLKKAKRWTLGLTLALAVIAPGATAHAGELPATANTQLAKVAELRQSGKPAEAIVLLESLTRETRQQPEASAAAQYVLADTYDRDLKDAKRARGIYGRLALAHTDGTVAIPGLGNVDIQQEALKRQDVMNRGHWLYKVMESITATIGNNPVTGRMLAAHSGVLAILLLTFLVKLALTPLTVKSFRSMREMQKLQPLMKQLQQN